MDQIRIFNGGRFSHSTRALRRGYIAALVILALICVGNFLVINALIRLQLTNASMFEEIDQIQGDIHEAHQDIAAIQQAIDHGSGNSLLESRTKGEMNRLAQDLESHLERLRQTLKQTHKTWISAGGTREASAQLESELAPRLVTLTDDIKRICGRDPTTAFWQMASWSAIQMQLSTDSRLDAAVTGLHELLHAKSRRDTGHLQRLHASLIAINLIALLAEALLIFRPLLKRLTVSYQGMVEASYELRRLATTDSLTGLGNRAEFHEHLSRIAKTDQPPPCALMLLDVDHFKNVNDIIGHLAGDQVLRSIGRRIGDWLGENGKGYRVGGDEFALIIQSPVQLGRLLEAADDLLTVLREPISHSNHESFIGASIGIATLDGQDPNAGSELLKRADLVLRTAKQTGRSTACLFTRSHVTESEKCEHLAEELARAIHEGALLPFYQPIIDIATERIIGLEALVRWQRNPQTILTPDRFLDVIERYGLMDSMTESLISRVAQDMRRCADAGFVVERVSVNLTESFLVDRQLPERLCRLLGTERLGQLQVEVVETALLHRASSLIKANLRKIQQLGATVALDDFGTGHASLTHLRNFPCDALKIDKSFVADMFEDQGALLIVRGIIDLASGLGMKVVVEGIERQEQYDYFRRWPHIAGQGYLMGHPQPLEQILAAQLVPVGGRAGAA